MESGFATLGRPHRSSPFDLPLSSRYQQVEQDRTSHVLSYHGELAWQTADQPRSSCEPDWQYQNQNRLDDPGRVGHGQISDRHSGQRRRFGTSLSGKGGVPWRMELSHFAQVQMTNLFLRDALVSLAGCFEGLQSLAGAQRPCLFLVELEIRGEQIRYRVLLLRHAAG